MIKEGRRRGAKAAPTEEIEDAGLRLTRQEPQDILTDGLMVTTTGLRGSIPRLPQFSFQ